MPTRRLRQVVVAVVVILAASIPGVAPGPGSTYVALGDSYASGTGTRAYLADGTACRRSVYAYPSLIASARGYPLVLRACSGASVSDVRTTQLDALGPTTSYVSLTVGGNDASFIAGLSECARPAWMSDCNLAIDRAQAIIALELPGRLAALHNEIRARAPRASVVVAGYPRIFNGEDCNAGTWFSPDEQRRLNATADMLNETAAAAAASAGFTFRNPTAAFSAHAVCDDVEWINGLSRPVSDSYHPNRAGHTSGYVPLLGPALTGMRVTITEETLQSAELSAPELTRQQEAYAEHDAAITPEQFVPPDLDAPAARAAAARAGVDLSDPDSIDRADRAAERRQNGMR